MDAGRLLIPIGFVSKCFVQLTPMAGPKSVAFLSITINVSAKLCWRGVALASVERELKKPRTDSTSLSNLAVHVIAASAHPRKYDNAHAGQC